MTMSLSRIGLIGDVHGEAARLVAALHFLRAARVERILCVGDIADGTRDDAADGAANANRCCDLLRQFEVETVRGNHDRWLLNGELRDLPGAVDAADLSADSRQLLRDLPRTGEFETVRGPLLLCHGVGENDMNTLRPSDEGYALECNVELQALMRARHFRFVVGGHSHQRMAKRFGELMFVNPGALIEEHDLSFALADFERGAVEFYGFAGDAIADLVWSVAL